MKTALTAFLLELDELRRHLEVIRLEWALLAAAGADTTGSDVERLAAQLRTQVASGLGKRRFDYNSIIVSLYGLIEQYVEALTREYATRLNLIVPAYVSLPDSLRNSHVELSFTLLNRLEQSRYRGTVTAQGLIANLHSCLTMVRTKVGG